MTFLEYMREKVGPNWCIARRTKRIVQRYGDDVSALTHKRYAALEKAWQTEICEKEIHEDLSVALGDRTLARLATDAIVAGRVRHVKAFG